MDIVSILIAVMATGILAALYAYVGFPAIAALLGAVCPRAIAVVERRQERRDVTVIISAYNEEKSLAAKIRNVFDTEYPPERLDVVVVSDASTDRTDDIARSFEDEGVRLLVQPMRYGKSVGLNHAMAMARGDIVVFTDANASFSREAIPTLVRYFTDP